MSYLKIPVDTPSDTTALHSLLRRAYKAGWRLSIYGPIGGPREWVWDNGQHRVSVYARDLELMGPGIKLRMQPVPDPSVVARVAEALGLLPREPILPQAIEELTQAIGIMAGQLRHGVLEPADEASWNYTASTP